MNILTTDPSAGWQRFIFGFCIFIVGLVVILSDASNALHFEVLGLMLLGGGFILAMTGYLPILIHRLTAAKRNVKRFESSHHEGNNLGKKSKPN